MAMEASYTLDRFLADTRATIREKGVPAGLAEIVTTSRDSSATPTY